MLIVIVCERAGDVDDFLRECSSQLEEGEFAKRENNVPKKRDEFSRTASIARMCFVTYANQLTPPLVTTLAWKQVTFT